MKTFFVCLLLTAGLAAQTGDLPGMPPLVDRNNVYAGAFAGNLSPAVKGFPDRVYVPNSVTNSVDVIDPATYQVIESFPVGREPQHVTPSYDLKTPSHASPSTIRSPRANTFFTLPVTSLPSNSV